MASHVRLIEAMHRLSEMTSHHPAPPLLEAWYRKHLPQARLDISSSGVSPWTVREFAALTHFDAGAFGDMDFDDGDSYGQPEIRDAVAEEFGRGDPQRVMITHGSSEAIYLAMTALLEPGDEVVVPSPSYHSLRSFARARRCSVRDWNIRMDGCATFDVDALRGLVSSSTKVIVVNAPHNPTGAHLTAAEASEIVDIARGAGAFLAWDAAFEGLAWTAGGDVPAPVDYERCVAFGTLSKSFGLPGLRVGWAIGPSDLLSAMVDVRDSVNLFLSPLVEAVGATAVRRRRALAGPRRERAARNREVLLAWARGFAGVELSEPGGGVCCFPRLVGVADTTDYCSQLLRRTGVLLVPGEAFDQPGHVRLGFGGSEADLAEGLTVLQRDLVQSFDPNQET